MAKKVIVLLGQVKETGEQESRAKRRERGPNEGSCVNVGED